jgi:hypothetical protein
VNSANWRLVIELIIPGLLITFCFILLCLGIDGEVKSILAVAAGWAFKASYDRTQGSGGNQT